MSFNIFLVVRLQGELHKAFEMTNLDLFQCGLLNTTTKREKILRSINAYVHFIICSVVITNYHFKHHVPNLVITTLPQLMHCPTNTTL